jgi:hypothetical protein
MQSIGAAYHSLDSGKRFNQREVRALSELIEKCDDPTQLKEADLYLSQGRMYEPEGLGGPDRVEFAKKSQGNKSDKEVLSVFQAAVRAKLEATGKDVPYTPSGPDSVDTLASASKVAAPRSEAARRYAVIIVDAHYSSDEPSGAEVGNMAAVLERANEKELPVFEVAYLGVRNHTTNRDLTRHRKRDTWVKIEKYTDSSFIGTNLHDELLERGVTDLVLMGCSQEACVMETARAANFLGYRVHTSFDLIQTTEAAEYARAEEPSGDFWTDPDNARLADRYDALPLFRDDIR